MYRFFDNVNSAQASDTNQNNTSSTSSRKVKNDFSSKVYCNFAPYLYLLDLDRIVEQTATDITTTTTKNKDVHEKKFLRQDFTPKILSFYSSALKEIFWTANSQRQHSTPYRPKVYSSTSEIVNEYNLLEYTLSHFEIYNQAGKDQYESWKNNNQNDDDNHQENSDEKQLLQQFRHCYFIELTFPFVASRNNIMMQQEKWNTFLNITSFPEDVWSARRAKFLIDDAARRRLFDRHREQQTKRDALPADDPNRNVLLMPRGDITDERLQQYVEGFKVLYPAAENDDDSDDDDEWETDASESSSSSRNHDESGDDESLLSRVEVLEEDGATTKMKTVGEVKPKKQCPESEAKAKKIEEDNKKKIRKASLSLENIKKLFKRHELDDVPSDVIINEDLVKFMDQFEIYPSRLGCYSSDKEFLGSNFVYPIWETKMFQVVNPLCPRSLTFFYKLAALGSEYGHESPIFMVDLGIYDRMIEIFPSTTTKSSDLEIESAIDFARLFNSESTSLNVVMTAKIDLSKAQHHHRHGANGEVVESALVKEVDGMMKPFMKQVEAVLPKIYNNLRFFVNSSNQHTHLTPSVFFYKKQVLIFTTIAVFRIITEIIQKLELSSSFFPQAIRLRKLYCEKLKEITFPALELCAKEMRFIESCQQWIDVVRNTVLIAPEIEPDKELEVTVKIIRDENHALRLSMIEAYELVGENLMTLVRRRASKNKNNNQNQNNIFDDEDHDNGSQQKYYIFDYFDPENEEEENFSELDEKNPLLFHYENIAPTSDECDAMKVQTLEHFIYLVWGLVVELAAGGADTAVMACLTKNGRTTSLADSFASVFVVWEDALKSLWKKRDSYDKSHRLYSIELIPSLCSDVKKRGKVVEAVRSQVAVQLTFFAAKKIEVAYDIVHADAYSNHNNNNNNNNDDDDDQNTNNNKMNNNDSKQKKPSSNSSASIVVVSSDDAFADDRADADTIATAGVVHTTDRRHVKVYLLSPYVAEFWNRFVAKHCIERAAKATATAAAAASTNNNNNNNPQYTESQLRESESFLSFWVTLDEAFGLPPRQRQKIFTPEEIAQFKKLYLNTKSITAFMAATVLATRNRTPKFRVRTLAVVKSGTEFNMLLWVSIFESLCVRFTSHMGRILCADNFKLFDDFFIPALGTCMYQNCDFYADVAFLFLSTYSEEMRRKIIANKDVVQYVRDSIGFFLASENPMQMIEAATTLNAILFRNAAMQCVMSKRDSLLMSTSSWLVNESGGCGGWRRIGSLGLMRGGEESGILSKETKMVRLGFEKE